MSRRKAPSSELIFENADRLERRIGDPSNKDDPRWLNDLARRARARARNKERVFEHKQNQEAKTSRGRRR